MRLQGTIVGIALVFVAVAAAAQDPPPVVLPPPHKDGGMPLMQALQRRATARAFARDSLPAQTLSDLLWAAWGINRPESGKRTAPSARNWLEIDVYVVMEKGVYVYDAAAHRLNPVVAGDQRELAGRQDFVKDAPVTLLLVAERSRMHDVPAAQVESYAWADAAFISQNIYLFCASEGLATGVRAMVDRPALVAALHLHDTQLVVFAQSVGFPAK